MPETATTAETLTERKSVPNKVQWPNRPVVTADKAAVIAALREQGVTTKAIAETMGLSTGTIYKADYERKRNGIVPLLSPKRIKKATRAIDAFMAGDPVGDVKPKCSTVLAAANVVLDRAYPKAQEGQGSGNVSFTQINVSLASVPQDVVLSTVDATAPVLVLNDKG